MDLEPIMVGQAEAEDPLLQALLEAEIGLLADGWDSEAVRNRCFPPPPALNCWICAALAMFLQSLLASSSCRRPCTPCIASNCCFAVPLPVRLGSQVAMC